MDPYQLYTCIAYKTSEVAHIWNLVGLSRYATLLDIEDGLNNFFLHYKCVHVDASGVMTLKWYGRDGSRIETTPAAFRTWFFTSVQPVTENIPVARPSTPILESNIERPKIDAELLEFLLAPSE